MKNILLLTLPLFLIGCASMDLRVDELSMGNSQGTLTPRVDASKCRYYTKENAPDPSTYTVLKQYIVQERIDVMMSRSTEDMISFIHQKAVMETGADAIIVDEVTTAQVSAGFKAKATPVIKVRSIRFKGELPANFVK